ncbi:LCP family protein [Candidatus Parcubacteria bacterium]|nr:LCP family protein [Candidatus Parcubacteria bacterium]
MPKTTEKINLKETEETLTKKTPLLENENTKCSLGKKIKKSNKKVLKIFIYLFIFLFTCLMVFSSQILVSKQSLDSWFYKLPIIKQIKHLAESADRALKGENIDRVNILLLGMGGKQHEGGYLTDTIILASLEPSTKKVALISIPRDLAIPVEDGNDLRKINSINAYAEMEQADSGGMAISQALGDILNAPIDYYFRVDFEAFVNLVDELGGVDVYVENNLDDYRYPVAGNEDAEDYESRFEHLHIEKGWQTMDGGLALKYARSRHGINGEGSDFARAKRQQNIILAVKNKLFNSKNLLKPAMIADIIKNFQDHISTNFKIWEIIKLCDLFKEVDKGKITNKVLDNSPNGLLTESISEQGAYILSPRSGDFAEIQYFINNVFSDAPEEVKVKVSKERVTIEVRNGTWINGLASQTALDIEKLGFIVVRIGNSSQQNFQKSVIYDLTYGEKSKSLAILKEAVSANVSFGLPDWLIEEISQEIDSEDNPIQPDFILILGQNADESNSGKENIEEDINEEPKK